MLRRRVFLGSLCGLPVLTRALAAQSKTLGDSNAPITIDVFSDFQCPGCKALYEGTLQPLMHDFVAKGKVYLIHRDFPLPMHAFARNAACLACASGKIGKYEAVSAALFRQQQTWAATGKVADALTSVLTASELQKVQKLAKDPQTMAEIEQDIALGKQRALTQTPTMIIASKGKTYPVSGVISYAILDKFLNSLLA
jgi:protein-disulfide isomerase